VMVLGLQGI